MLTDKQQQTIRVRPDSRWGWWTVVYLLVSITWAAFSWNAALMIWVTTVQKPVGK